MQCVQVGIKNITWWQSCEYYPLKSWPKSVYNPPDPFKFKTPDDWPHRRRRFKQFQVALGLTGDAQTRQISTILYCLGEEAEAVLTSTNATEEERRTYDTVIETFNGFFKIGNNAIFEQARFNRRSQIEGETADEYFMVLYRLDENCEYGAMTSEMIRDRIVVGIRNYQNAYS